MTVPPKRSMSRDIKEQSWGVIIRTPCAAPSGLREWHTNNLGRLPGLKFMRTLWVCNISGGPFEYAATQPGSTSLGLEEAHRELRISPEEFDEVAAELGRTLDFVEVPQREKDEVLGAFAAHKAEVTAGFVAAAATASAS